MKIYTKTGDSGSTGLISGRRVSKDDPLLEAYGTVDELNALLGTVIAETVQPEWKNLIQAIQNELFEIGADLAAPWEDRESSAMKNVVRLTTDGFGRLEKEIDSAEEKLPPIRNFILPGGTQIAARLHFARTVCRRAERRVVALIHDGRANPNILTYLNRLSDWLFVMARKAHHDAGQTDIPWKAPSRR